MKQNNQTIKDNDMNKENTTTTIVKTIHELSLRVKAIRELPLRIVRNGMLFAIGFFGTTILAVAISGTIKTWTTGEVLKSADLNTTIASLQTVIQNIPNWTKAANGNDAYYTAGNVGIGTAAPGSLLEVSGAAAQVRLTDTTTTNPILNFYEGSTRAATIESYLQELYLTTKGAKDILFRTNNTEKMRITSAGNVGIGTTSPQTSLDIASTLNNFLTLTRTNKASGSGEFNINVESTSETTFSFDSSQSLNIGTSTDPSSQAGFSEKMRINSAGRVGIGRIPTTHLLEVAGSAGLTTGTAWTNISDERLKNIDGTISSALDNLLKLNPIKYKYNEASGKLFKNADGKSKYGFTAQNVKSVFPEMVITDDKGYLWYNPSGFEAILTSAIKEVALRLRSGSDSIRQVSDRVSAMSDSVSVVTQKIESLEKEKAANEKKLLSLEEDNKRLRETVETLRATSLQSTITSQRVQQLEDRLRAIENTQMAKK
jgi:hypothetical protein